MDNKCFELIDPVTIAKLHIFPFFANITIMCLVKKGSCR